MNAYGFAGGDRINFDDPFGLTPVCQSMPQLCVLGAGAAAAAGTVGAGALVAAAAPFVAAGTVIGGAAVWASQPVTPTSVGRSVPGALVTGDATAVSMPPTMEMGQASRTLGKYILIGLGILHPDGPKATPQDVRRVPGSRRDVERSEEFETVKALGVHLVQGFFLHKPSGAPASRGSNPQPLTPAVAAR